MIAPALFVPSLEGAFRETRLPLMFIVGDLFSPLLQDFEASGCIPLSVATYGE
jgi:hypothetical protein